MNATLPGSSLKDFSRILSCFAKIGDDVALEVRPGKVSSIKILSRSTLLGAFPLTWTRVVVVHAQCVAVGVCPGDDAGDAVRAVRVRAAPLDDDRETEEIWW